MACLDLVAMLRRDHRRWRALGFVSSLALPGACIGAGFIRNMVWEHQHGRQSDCRDEDIDVLWYDPSRPDASADREAELRLRALAPDFSWSVRNQARMHQRNGDAPYTSIDDAMRAWPETATAIAALRHGDDCEIRAPFGLDDLAGMILRPTSSEPRKLEAFQARVRAKRWLERWPHVRIAPAYDALTPP
ncbi:nucleotidyltransferase family protein [Roseovarius sp.]|uniref:nucleotidyltransferase family protein n=1 Tax=Roseovarius sp. TaxID=1486281 RepID=UPI0035677B8E